MNWSWIKTNVLKGSRKEEGQGRMWFLTGFLMRHFLGVTQENQQPSKLQLAQLNTKGSLTTWSLLPKSLCPGCSLIPRASGVSTLILQSSLHWEHYPIFSTDSQLENTAKTSCGLCIGTPTPHPAAPTQSLCLGLKSNMPMNHRTALNITERFPWIFYLTTFYFTAFLVSHGPLKWLIVFDSNSAIIKIQWEVHSWFGFFFFLSPE